MLHDREKRSKKGGKKDSKKTSSVPSSVPSASQSISASPTSLCTTNNVGCVEFPEGSVFSSLGCIEISETEIDDAGKYFYCVKLVYLIKMCEINVH